MKRTFGADIGYSSGKNSSSLNIPPSYGDYNYIQAGSVKWINQLCSKL